MQNMINQSPSHFNNTLTESSPSLHFFDISGHITSIRNLTGKHYSQSCSSFMPAITSQKLISLSIAVGEITNNSWASLWDFPHPNLPNCFRYRPCIFHYGLIVVINFNAFHLKLIIVFLSEISHPKNVWNNICCCFSNAWLGSAAFMG